MKLYQITIALALSITCVHPSYAANSISDLDKQCFFYAKTQKEVCFPIGRLVFAKKVTEDELGNCAKKGKSKSTHNDLQHALGAPDKEFVSLGCNGYLTVKINSPLHKRNNQPVLFVVEAKRVKETAIIDILSGKNNRLRLGTTDKNRYKHAFDIGSNTKSIGRFLYVRITDSGQNPPTPETPGFDLDAVGVLGKDTLVFPVASFDSDIVSRHYMKKIKNLAKKLAKYDKLQLDIVGHADSDGGMNDNMALSMQRAESVANYLQKQPGISNFKVNIKGFGEEKGTKGSDKSQARRVDLIVRFKP